MNLVAYVGCGTENKLSLLKEIWGYMFLTKFTTTNLAFFTFLMNTDHESLKRIKQKWGDIGKRMDHKVERLD